MTDNRLHEIFERAASKRFLVIGDLMLDEFVWGKVGRISPEAPVPVVEVTGESFYPGGAANVARNLREFSDAVAVAGLIGQDPSGERLRELLVQRQIELLEPFVAADFHTIVKTRIIARHQQVVRVDRERMIAPSPDQIKSVVDTIRKKLSEIDAIIFEDYGKGFLAAELIASIAADARAAGKIVAADPNPHNPVQWRQLTVVKPNRAEAFLAAGMPCRDSDSNPADDAALKRAGEQLLKRWGVKYILVTLGEQGMMLFETGQPAHHVPTKARQVFDVSGAGDTAIALFTLALTGGASAIEAAEIANHGSAVVVGKLGTATVTPEEVHASFREDDDSI